jgi:MSHA pilin protein MshA
MNNQKGFTLIELIVVIVILGILSAVAVPKFVDMQGEAKAGVLQGIRGSWKSAVMMAHGKWLAAGDTTSTTFKVDGEDIELINGYPTAIVANLEGLVDLDTLTATNAADDEFIAEVGVNDAEPAVATLTITYGSHSFVYTEATVTAKPSTTVVE